MLLRHGVQAGGMDLMLACAGVSARAVVELSTLPLSTCNCRPEQEYHGIQPHLAVRGHQPVLKVRHITHHACQRACCA